MDRTLSFRSQAGFSMLEVLITIVILAFGLLGLAALQSKIQVAETESFQRAQALLLVQDMADRIGANRVNADDYLTGAGTLGTGDSQPASCALLAGSAKDKCEWSNELKGASETQSSSTVGAMTGALGCIEKEAGTNPTVYRVSVAWQGMVVLHVPTINCGKDSYGEDGYRRVLAYRVSIANLTAP